MILSDSKCRPALCFVRERWSQLNRPFVTWLHVNWCNDSNKSYWMIILRFWNQWKKTKKGLTLREIEISDTVEIPVIRPSWTIFWVTTKGRDPKNGIRFPSDLKLNFRDPFQNYEGINLFHNRDGKQRSSKRPLGHKFSPRTAKQSQDRFLRYLRFPRFSVSTFLKLSPGRQCPTYR